MKRIVVALAAAALISTTVAAPAFADGWGRHSHEVTAVDVLLWPITIPAAIIGGIAQATIPHPVVYEAPAPAYQEGPAAYAGPRGYYAPSTYYAPRGYYGRSEYYRPGGYYERRNWHGPESRYYTGAYGGHGDRW